MANDRSLTVSKIIQADKATIYKALTDQKIMEKWFCAGPDGWSSSVKNRITAVGEPYEIHMHNNNGETHSHYGEYKEVIPNEKIVFSWSSQAVENTLVTITLTDVADGTEVSLQHDFMPNEQMVQNHTNGWTVILDRLSGVTATV